MAVINTNSGAMRAQNSSRLASAAQATAMERLSSGKRINSAKDDAAGLAISNTMTAQIKGMNQGIRNANDGISLAQTAEGALGEVTNILQRVRELAVQAKSGTYSNDDRTNIQAEITALTAQVSDVLDNTKYNGVSMFDKTGVSTADKKFTIQTGANGFDTVEIKIKSIDGTTFKNEVTAATAPATDPQAGRVIGMNVTGVASAAATTAMTTANAMASGTDTEKASKATAVAAANALIESSKSEDAIKNAGTTLTNVDTALRTVNTVRADLGASQSRLESVVNVQTNNATNLSDARSRIEDTDYSIETTNLAKAQILSQASQAMLAQANQSSQGVMSLLR
ncbi:flagellin [Sphingomonas montana]|uniref:flagellin N-terminal helical domain-containing protein n=1 Tax=Sphingomonas montana TaxID=1843236 RepID=UPI00096EEBCD|nr:flagellin [Sphingomonas montana]